MQSVLSNSFLRKVITTVIQWILLHDELAATVIIGVHLYVDWYLGLAFSAQLLTLALLFIIFLQRSSLRPWVKPRALWLWILFLVLAIFPATRGLYLRDTVYYYFNVIFNALLIFWLGIAVAQDAASLRRLFKLLAILGALLAIHTIIQARTGVLLFKTTRYDASIQQLSNFELGNTGIYRAEAFLRNPDSNGAWFAIMFFLPLGLFAESSSVREKVLYLGEMALILLALLFTYTVGAWLSVLVGIIIFAVLVGQRRYRIQIAVFLLVAPLILLIGFPSQTYHLLQHASDPSELPLRIGAWETALRVIQAFPLVGVGLGSYVYIVRAEPYRVPAQFLPLYHPHNSYLEFAVLGGVQLSLVFLGLLLLALWLAVRNWKTADVSGRSLVGAGLAAVVVLSCYSLSNTGWTLTPLTALGWLILGAISSPLLMRKNSVASQEKEKVASVHTDQQHE